MLDGRENKIKIEKLKKSHKVMKRGPCLSVIPPSSVLSSDHTHTDSSLSLSLNKKLKKRR